MVPNVIMFYIPKYIYIYIYIYNAHYLLSRSTKLSKLHVLFHVLFHFQVIIEGKIVPVIYFATKFLCVFIVTSMEVITKGFIHGHILINNRFPHDNHKMQKNILNIPANIRVLILESASRTHTVFRWKANIHIFRIGYIMLSFSKHFEISMSPVQMPKTKSVFLRQYSKVCIVSRYKHHIDAWF